MRVTDYKMSYYMMSHGYNFNHTELFGIYRYVNREYKIVSVSYISDNADRNFLNSMMDANILPVFNTGSLLIILMDLLKNNKDKACSVMCNILPFIDSDKAINVIFNEITKQLNG